MVNKVLYICYTITNVDMQCSIQTYTWHVYSELSTDLQLAAVAAAASQTGVVSESAAHVEL